MPDPFTEDPKIDIFFPPEQEFLVIESGRFYVNGFIELASGKGPHSTIILFHGFPGIEKNGDLVQIFRRAGFNVVVFSYRGSWGSHGSFSFKNCVEDGVNVVSFLREHYEKYRINPDDIILIGTSFGGFVALYTAFKIPNIDRVASVSGFHLNLAKEVFEKSSPGKDALLDLFNHSMSPLVGTSPNNLLQEVLNIDSWDFSNYYSILAKKDVFLIAALKDEICPPEQYHFPLIKSLEEFKPTRLFNEIFYDAHHSYADHRIKLTRVLLNWLLKTSSTDD